MPRARQERALLYFDLLGVSLGDAARTAFEELMNRGTYEYQSDFAKKHRAAGKAEGKALSVLQFLEARGVSVSAEQREHVLACTDIPTLEGWVRKAATAASAEDLFA